MFHGIFFGNVLLHADLLLIEAHALRTGTDITVVGISHLTGTIDDTAHDSDLQALHVLRGLTDLRDGVAEVIEGAAAAGAGDILRLRRAQPGSLEDAETRLVECLFGDIAIVEEPDAVGKSVDHQGAEVSGGLELEVFLLLSTVAVHLGEDDGVLYAGVHHLVDEGTLVAEAVLVVARADDNHFGMSLQTSEIFLGGSTEL